MSLSITVIKDTLPATYEKLPKIPFLPYKQGVIGSSPISPTITCKDLPLATSELSPENVNKSFICFLIDHCQKLYPAI